MSQSPGTAAAAPSAAMPRYRDAALRVSAVAHEVRADGTVLVRPVQAPVPVPYLTFSAWARRWADERGGQAALGQRDASGAWRVVSAPLPISAGIWCRIRPDGVRIATKTCRCMRRRTRTH